MGKILKVRESLRWNKSDKGIIKSWSPRVSILERGLISAIWSVFLLFIRLLLRESWFNIWEGFSVLGILLWSLIIGIRRLIILKKCLYCGNGIIISWRCESRRSESRRFESRRSEVEGLKVEGLKVEGLKVKSQKSKVKVRRSKVWRSEGLKVWKSQALFEVGYEFGEFGGDGDGCVVEFVKGWLIDVF